jgi:gliding motility-associated lipoprotein GldD
MINSFRILSLCLVLLNFSCQSDSAQPKPKGYLYLSYPAPEYSLNSGSDYSFDLNQNAASFEELKRSGWAKINYPSQKATLDLTYRKVENNLRDLLIESEKMTFSHTIKADDISSQNYEDLERGIYARVYEVGGDAASNLQFQVHDSTKNFLTGSVYFKVKPNFDSIEPSIDYIRRDVIRLIESIQWNELP